MKRQSAYCKKSSSFFRDAKKLWPADVSCSWQCNRKLAKVHSPGAQVAHKHLLLAYIRWHMWHIAC